MRDLITLSQHLAVGVGGVSGQETWVDGVVDDLNSFPLDAKQLLNFALGEVRNRKDSRSMFEHPARKMKMEHAPQARSVVRAVHVVEQVVHGHDIGARQ